MTTKQKANKIKKWCANIPSRQIAPCVYIDKIGSKYIYILDTWKPVPTSMYKITIDDFYNNNLKESI